MSAAESQEGERQINQESGNNEDHQSSISKSSDEKENPSAKDDSINVPPVKEEMHDEHKESEKSEHEALQNENKGQKNEPETVAPGPEERGKNSEEKTESLTVLETQPESAAESMTGTDSITVQSTVQSGATPQKNDLGEVEGHEGNNMEVDAAMTKDPGIEEDELDIRNDKDVDMESQSTSTSDPAPDSGQEDGEKGESKDERSSTPPVDGGEKDDGEKSKKLKKSKDSGSSNDWSSSGEGSDNGRPWHGWGSRKPRKIVLPRLTRYSSYDTEQYRNGYPGKRDDYTINDNLQFYTNQIPSYPEGDLVDNIHEKWWGNYRLLEYHHSYIQWLFPIRERGLNWHAKELQPREIEEIIKDEKAHKRVLKSYRMMLDFYGLELMDEKTGEVKRSGNWKEQFDNLNYSGHNYLRITRILKCLGEFNYEHLKIPLIKHFLYEAIIERTLINALNSCCNYWIEVVKDEKRRNELHSYAKELVDQANNNTD